MTICHVNLARGFRGGERQTILLIQELGKRGVGQVLVCRPDSPMIEMLTGVNDLKIHVANHFLLGHWAAPACDLIHAHDAKGAHWAFWEHWFKGSKYLVTRRVPNRLKQNRITRAVYAKASILVAISQAIAKQLTSYVRREDIVVIPDMCSNLSLDTHVAQKIGSTYRGAFVLGHIGALVDRHKGQGYLIEAARILHNEIPNLRLLFLGDGEDREKLQRQAADLDFVEFLGFKKNVADYLSVFDLFVFPSLDEGLGSILLDVMQFSIPIIATEVGGIPDVVTHEETGLLIPPANVEAIVSAVKRLKENPHLAKSLSRSAALKLDAYSPEALTGRYMALYKKVKNEN